MKKILSFTIASFMAITAVADSYYYYNGMRIPLIANAEKCAVISVMDTSESAQPSKSKEPVQQYKDSCVSVKVYNATDVSDIKVESCYYTSSGRELIPSGYIAIKLYKATDFDLLSRLVSSYSLEIVEQDPFMPLWFTVRIKDGGQSVVDIANKLYETGLFAYCYPDFIEDCRCFTYDENILDQWHLYQGVSGTLTDISANHAWDYATGRGIKIAIVDDGVDLNHVDLKDNIAGFYNATVNSSLINSQIPQCYTYLDPVTHKVASHGTMCAGVAAAVRNNGIMISGVAPDAQILSCASHPSIGTSNSSSAAINWACNNGADIISCSWGSAPSDKIREAIENAVNNGRNGKGCIVIASSGNYYSKLYYDVDVDQTPEVRFPANMADKVIAVGSSSESGLRSLYSCYGPELFICAPGENILTTQYNNELETFSGTSASCPCVAGIVALILERNPSLSVEQVRNILARSTIRPESSKFTEEHEYGLWSEEYGYGVINAYRAVKNTPKGKTDN